MKNRLFRNYLAMICLPAMALFAHFAWADWNENQAPGYNSQNFGNYPPVDIDQQIDKEMNQVKRQKDEQLFHDNTSPTTSQTDSFYHPATPHRSAQNPQPPSYYGRYNQHSYPRYESSGGNPWRNVQPNPWISQGSRFSNPWNHNSTRFSMPWNNNTSNFTAPWNNGSGFSMPWDNSRSRFSDPWNNNANFSMPGGNNNPGNNNPGSHNPWHNRNGW